MENRVCEQINFSGWNFQTIWIKWGVFLVFLGFYRREKAIGPLFLCLILLCSLFTGCSANERLSDSRVVTTNLIPETKPMFKLIDSYSPPEGVNDLAWNAQSNKLVVGAWKMRQGDVSHYSSSPLLPLSVWQKENNRKYNTIDAFVAVLDVKNDKLYKTHQFKLNPLIRGQSVVAISPDDRYIAVGNTTVELFDLKENSSVWMVEHGIENALDAPYGHTSLAFSEDGRLLSLGSIIEADKKLPNGQWDSALHWGAISLSNGVYKSNYKVLTSNSHQHSAVIDNRWSVTSEMTTHEVNPRRAWIVVRELATGKEISRLEPTRPLGGELNPTALALSQNGRYLAIGGRFRNKSTKGYTQIYLQIWNIKEQRLLHEYIENGKEPLPPGSMIGALVFSPNSRWLLMNQGQENNSIPDLHLFNVESGQRLWSSENKMVGPGTCRFSPSGEMFACRGNRNIRLFKQSN